MVGITSVYIDTIFVFYRYVDFLTLLSFTKVAARRQNSIVPEKTRRTQKEKQQTQGGPCVSDNLQYDSSPLILYGSCLC